MSYYLLKRGYSGDKNESSQSKTVTITDAPNSSTPFDVFPEVGDYLTDLSPQFNVEDNKFLILRSINESFLDDRCNYLVWTLSYATRDEDEINQEGEASEESLPVSITNGGEIVNWTPPKEYKSNFRWIDATGHVSQFNNTSITQNLTKFVSLRTYVFSRRVTDLQSFKTADDRCSHRLNANTFYGIPRGLLLYTGSDIESYVEPSGRKNWMTRMTFVRRITSPNWTFNEDGSYAGGEVDGWQYCLREEDGQFSAPQIQVKNQAGIVIRQDFQFGYADFKGLITSGYGIRETDKYKSIGE